MAANVQRGGLGFEKFFKRRSTSADRSREAEKISKNFKDEAETTDKEEPEGAWSKLGKFFGQSETEDKNEAEEKPPGNEVSSEKTDSKKSSKRKKPEVESRISKPEDKSGSEGCKEFVVKDDLCQIKLTEVINNSIKEAVLNIVKEGVCPLANSPNPRTTDVTKNVSTLGCQEAQDVENKPKSPKQPSSLLSAAEKTFDSHLCRSQYQQTSKMPSQAPCKTNEPKERTGQSQCVREISPRVCKPRKLTKCSKPKDRGSREGSPKMCKQAKARSSHFRTDNRRMTGNVNIYICSEANENAKDKQKSKSKRECLEESEAGSESTSSSLSVSTSKLVAALKKKRRKNLEENLNCLCEDPESSDERGEDKVTSADNRFSTEEERLRAPASCEDNFEDTFVSCSNAFNAPSFSSTDALGRPSNSSTDAFDEPSVSCTNAFVCDDKFSEADLGSEVGSLEKACSSGYSEGFDSSEENFRESENCRSRDDEERKKRLSKKCCDDRKNVEEGCLCCDLCRCKKERISGVPCRGHWKGERRSRDGRASRDKQQFDKCLCVVQEEDEDCCVDNKKSEEKLTVCGIPGSGGEALNENRKNEEDFSTFETSRSEKSDSPTLKKKKSVRTVDSKENVQRSNEKSETKEVAEKPRSPKLSLLSSFRKNFKRSPSRDHEAKGEEVVEDTERADQINLPKDTAVPEEEKTKNSFLFRSIKKAMNIVKTGKDEILGAVQKEDKTKKDQQKIEENENSDRGVKLEPANSDGGSIKSSKEEKRSTRIGAAIASRRSSVASSKESLNRKSLDEGSPGESHAPTGSPPFVEGIGVEVRDEQLQSCKCSESSKRPCEKSESGMNDNRKTGSAWCEKSMASRPEPRVCCSGYGNQVEGCSRRCKGVEAIEESSGNCCLSCDKPIEDCECRCSEPGPPREGLCPRCRGLEPLCRCSKTENPKEGFCPRCRRLEPLCRCSKTENPKEGFCTYCRKPERLCRCSKTENPKEGVCTYCRKPERLCCCSEEKPPANKLQPECQQPRASQGDYRRCDECRAPEAECRSCETFSTRECPKSMICVYCDEPQDNCSCRAAVRKCSRCGLPDDVCNCKPTPCCECSGRRVATQEEGDRGASICVTAWKPRRNIRRYFERGARKGDFQEDCECYEKSKPYGSDRLPYQKGSVFSDVMSELQQKISGSVCCDVCRNAPCDCCCREAREKVDRRAGKTLSPIAERSSVWQSRERSRSDSPRSCRCGSSPRRESKRGLKICGRCRTSPCRCRRSALRKKPTAKCFYCKASPCTCSGEPANQRPFRRADSSHRRRKERSSTTEERANADVENEDNGQRGRESRSVVPCPGRQIPRKYRRGNPPGQRNNVELVG